MRHLRKAAAICKNQKLLAALICAAKLCGSGFLHGLNRSEHDSITILAIGPDYGRRKSQRPIAVRLVRSRVAAKAVKLLFKELVHELVYSCKVPLE
jgi:hypothetical protein